MLIKNKSTRITIGINCLNKLSDEIKRVSPFKLGIVTDKTVANLWLDKVLESIVSTKPIIMKIGDDERSKNLSTVKSLWRTLIENNLTRKSLLIALGGGLVGDVTGFVASTFMRGMDFAQVPTTLLAQVDASIGGKTGINFHGKNMIGTFYQPKFVLIDTQFVETLPTTEFLSGLAETIKHSIICDRKLFRFLEKYVERIKEKDQRCLQHIVERSVRIKTRIVEKDERESGLRLVLNLGHTVGHAIERSSDYGIRHGHAISIGMVVACRIAEKILSFSETSGVEKLLKRLGLPVTHNLDANKILKAIKTDKKAWLGKVVFILPEKIGKVRVMEVPEKIILNCLKEAVKEK